MPVTRVEWFTPTGVVTAVGSPLHVVAMQLWLVTKTPDCSHRYVTVPVYPAEQPKAIGSSILAKLANILVTDAMKISGLQSIDNSTTLILPLCTGMSLCSVFNALRAHQREEQKQKEDAEERNTIVWTRLDQKTCIKSIQASGYNVCVVEPKLEGDELVTNLQALIKELSEENRNKKIACVVSSTCLLYTSPSPRDS